MFTRDQAGPQVLLNRIRSELKDPSLTPTQLRLLMGDYQTISLQIQETTDDAKRIETSTSKPPTKFRHFIEPKTPRPPSRQEKAPAPSRVQDRETQLTQPIPEEEDFVFRNPTTSGSSRHDRARSPGEGASSSSRSPSSLPRPWSPQSWETMTGSSSNQPEYSSSLSSQGLSRSTSQRSVPNQYNIPPNQRPPAWGAPPPLTNQPFHPWQHPPPPRSHTVQPDGRRISSTSQSRTSTPHSDRNLGLHQGVPSPPMTPRRIRRRSSSRPRNDKTQPIPEEEDFVFRNPTTSSGSSKHDRARSPGEGASPSSRSPSNLYRPWSPQSWDTTTGASSNQPEYTSSSSLSSKGLSRSTSQRSVPNQCNIPPDQKPPAWGVPPPLTNQLLHPWQHAPPPRSHTVHPDGCRIKDRPETPRSTPEEDIVWPRRNPTPSESSQQDRARSPEESPSSPRQRNPTSLSLPWGSSQGRDRMTASLSRQPTAPANPEPTTISPGGEQQIGMFNDAEVVNIHGGTFIFIVAG